MFCTSKEPVKYWIDADQLNRLKVIFDDVWSIGETNILKEMHRPNEDIRSKDIDRIVHTQFQGTNYQRGTEEYSEARLSIIHWLRADQAMKIEVETSFIYKSICQVDADAIDRLNNRYTAIALIACFLMITAKIYVGHPINCWGPSKFEDQAFFHDFLDTDWTLHLSTMYSSISKHSLCLCE